MHTFAFAKFAYLQFSPNEYPPYKVCWQAGELRAGNDLLLTFLIWPLFQGWLISSQGVQPGLGLEFNILKLFYLPLGWIRFETEFFF